MREWYSAQELLGQPWCEYDHKRSLHRVAKGRGWKWRERAGQGGEHEYHISSPPPETQIALLKNYGPTPEQLVEQWETDAFTSFLRSLHPKTEQYLLERRARELADREAAKRKSLKKERWEDVEGWRREEATRLVALVSDFHDLRETTGRSKAAEMVAAQYDVNRVTVYRHWGKVVGRPKDEWGNLLLPAPKKKGRRRKFDTEALSYFEAIYLTRNGPSWDLAYDETKIAALKNGWAIPLPKTAKRMFHDKWTDLEIGYYRNGREWLARQMWLINRDPAMFAAGEAVSADGLKFDTFWVDMGNGDVINTVTGWFIFDIKTGRCLAWKLGQVENSELIRLATHELLGICTPKYYWLDNTMAASNSDAGGPRRRFGKRSPDAFPGYFDLLGIDVQRTDPNQLNSNPGAKGPAERGFGIGGIQARARAAARALNRGYSSKTAITFTELREIVREAVARHNAKKGRRSAICNGVLSFNEAWEREFDPKTVELISEKRRAMLLLSSEIVQVHTGKPQVTLKAGQNEHGRSVIWNKELGDHKGKQVRVYFDPTNLDAPMYIFDSKDNEICETTRQPTLAFKTDGEHKEWLRLRNREQKAIAEGAKAKKQMDDLTAASLTPKTAPYEPEKSESNIVSLTPKLAANGLPRQQHSDSQPDRFTEVFSSLVLDEMRRKKASGGVE